MRPEDLARDGAQSVRVSLPVRHPVESKSPGADRRVPRSTETPGRKPPSLTNVLLTCCDRPPARCSGGVWPPSFGAPFQGRLRAPLLKMCPESEVRCPISRTLWSAAACCRFGPLEFDPAGNCTIRSAAGAAVFTGGTPVLRKQASAGQSGCKLPRSKYQPLRPERRYVPTLLLSLLPILVNALLI